MSDTPMAPDWWLASDGKWYPPTSLPGPAYPVAAPPAHVSPVLSGWVQGLLWLGAVLGAVMMVTSLHAWSIVGADDFNRFLNNDWLPAHDRHAVSMALFMVAFLANAVLVIIWTHKAHKATDALQPYHRSWSPGWSIGAWFIPLANLVIPKLILGETERIARTPRSDEPVGSRWRSQSTSAIGWVWWLTFVAGWMTFGVGSSFDVDEPAVRAASDLLAGYILLGASGFFYMLSGAFGAIHVRNISALLTPEQMNTSADATAATTWDQTTYYQR